MIAGLDALYGDARGYGLLSLYKLKSFSKPKITNLILSITYKKFAESDLLGSTAKARISLILLNLSRVTSFSLMQFRRKEH